MLVLTLLLGILLSACATTTSQTGADANISQQRKDFISARALIGSGEPQDSDRLAPLLATLRNYPLVSYLEFDLLTRRLSEVQPEAINAFLTSNEDTVLSNRLRKIWIGELRRREDWPALIATYRTGGDVTAQCHYLTARLKLGQSGPLWSSVKDLWLTGRPLPEPCTEIVDQFLLDSRTTPALVWDNVRSALAKGENDYARGLSVSLDPQLQRWVSVWAKVNENPSMFSLYQELQKDDDTARDILVSAVQRLAPAHYQMAATAWKTLLSRHKFQPEQLARAEKVLALAAAASADSSANQRLDAVADVDGNVQNSRLQSAIATRDWTRLAKWTQEKALSGMEESRWRYWHAQALAKLGQHSESRTLLQDLAADVGYYGRLSAESLGSWRISLDTAQAEPNAQQPALLAAQLRARELYFCGYLAEARDEWGQALNALDKSTLPAAAQLAASWNWPDRVIATLGKLPSNQYVGLRFPVPYRELVESNANQRKLPVPLVYGLMRTESIFMEDAHSRTGALGLMQLMPATAQEVAQRLGRRLDNADLLLASVNVPLGTSYLARLLDHFHGNVVLSVAAYNAGPTRVNSWLPQQQCEPADYWVERIPFSETRAYVRNVLFAASIYSGLVSSTGQSLTALLQVPIAPRSDRGLFTVNCAFEGSRAEKWLG